MNSFTAIPPIEKKMERHELFESLLQARPKTYPVLGFLRFLAKDIDNYFWKASQDFPRFFKIVERNPKKFLEILAPKPKISQILAREARKSCIKVIKDLCISYRQLSLKTQKWRDTCVCFHLNLNVA